MKQDWDKLKTVMIKIMALGYSSQIYYDYMQLLNLSSSQCP
jgi:hypothetical protein